MNVDEILELMDELLDKSSNVPFSNKKVIDVEQMREYIDSIRLNLPGEIKRAKDMTRDKKNILTEANKEADEIIKKAKEEAKKLVAQEEILKQAADYAKQVAEEANKQAADIVAQAQAKDKAIRQALSDNLNKTLADAAEVLTKSLKDVNSTRDAVSKIGSAE
ncbi:ATPase [Ruminococcus sp.]|uniref:ATPase n=1 Tax=Ruminococcus sp. TaxID=41978 RepID=UPI0025E3BB23|nr:ATPase [Ruminococcus sp.]